MILIRLQRANRIYAKKCNLKEVSTKDATQFMKNNHLEGFVGGGTKLGWSNNRVVPPELCSHCRKWINSKVKA